jgi:alpha-L-fucosidase
MAFLASDSDYCFTARSRGWEVWLAAQARGFHKPHAAISADRELELRKLKDVLYFANKWLTGELFRNLADASEETDPTVNRQWIEKISESIRHYSSIESRS